MISNRILWLLVTAVIVAKFALVGWWPFLALMHMPRDATLFLTQAMSILEGEWLGSYTEKTLMKGPVTPLWIALMNFLGIPLLLSHHIFYTAACVLGMLALRRFTDSNLYLLFVFVLLQFNPFSYSYGPIASGLREMLHQPVVLAMMALSIILLADFVKHRTVNTGFTILFGVMLFMFWNNREEGIWVVPYLLWLSFVGVLYVIYDLERPMSVGKTGLLQLILIPAAIWAAGTYAIAWKNYQEYDVFAVVELKTPEFKRAFGGLLGIDAQEWHPRYAAQPDVLDKLYALPSGSELDLDQKTKEPRKRIPSLVLPWTFRSAVSNAGYYDRGGAAVLEFYDRLGAEIEAACAQQKFACSTSLFGVFPPWHAGYARAWSRNFNDVFTKVMGLGKDKNIDDFNSWGTDVFFLSVSRLVNSPVRAVEGSQGRLPPFYLRMKKNKTRYLKKLLAFYRYVIPYLFWLAAMGAVSGIILFFAKRRASLLRVVYFGVAGTLLLQLVIFTLLRITGYSFSTRLFFMFYPVFYIFIAMGLLSLTQDLRFVVSWFHNAMAMRRWRGAAQQ